MEDWVRARSPGRPARTPVHCVQLQFHCGKPPPADDPRTSNFIEDIRSGQFCLACAAAGAAQAEPWKIRAARFPEKTGRRAAYELAGAVLTGGDVHRNFEAEAKIDGSRGFPGHL
jgi:hypothetical protein